MKNKMIGYCLVLFVVITALYFPKQTLAQWNYFGTNIYNSNSGYVGIGTLYPTTKLEVGGGDVTIANNQGYRIKDPGGTGRVGMMIDSVGNQIYGASAMSNGGDLLLRVPSFNNGAVRIKAVSGWTGIGTTNPGARLEVAEGVIKSFGNRGYVFTAYISSIGWYSQQVLFAYPWGTIPTVTLTQDNSGTGDISIISHRIKKNSMNLGGFTIEFYVNAVPQAGTTKFNWLAIE